MVPAGLRRWLDGRATGVKVCGITRREDARAAVEAGVDALGFNFYPKSKRWVRLETIAPWVAELPPEIGRVAVVVNPDEVLMQELLGSGFFHAVQFHGHEEPEFCARWGGVFYVRACPLIDEDSAREALADPAPALLLDAHAPGVFGGTGRTIDWRLAAGVTSAAGRPVVLSGGLNAENVTGAVRQVKPMAVDTASGVETAPGVKDAGLMRRFVAAVRAGQADERHS
ncbi:MAG: phosphoribosylanthranilate isomerase [Chthoniobacterales bacterium]|jgi:phosphoribosylanthranilate isomerase